jgi:hypothetical protein
MTVLAYLPLVLQSILLYVLVRGKTYRTFVWFFAYTSFSILATTGRFALRNHRGMYFYFYWGTDAIYSILGALVMYEVCRVVFRNLGKARWLQAVFILLAIISVSLTLGRTSKPLPGAEHSLMTWVVGAELGLRFFQVLIFVMLSALVALLGLRWRQHAFGISAGYGIYAAVNLFTTTRFYEFGTRFTFMWGFVSVITYTIAVLIWLWYFSTPIRKVAVSSEGPPLSLQDLERYKDTARRVPRL